MCGPLQLFVEGRAFGLLGVDYVNGKYLTGVSLSLYILFNGSVELINVYSCQLTIL